MCWSPAGSAEGHGEAPVFPSPGCLLHEDAGILPLLKQHLILMVSLQQASLQFCFAVLPTPFLMVSFVHTIQNLADFDEKQKPTCFLLIWTLPAFCWKETVLWWAEGDPAAKGQGCENVVEGRKKAESCWECQLAPTSSPSSGLSTVLREVRFSRTLTKNCYVEIARGKLK